MNALARLTPVAVALIGFAIYVAAAVPTVYWLDSSEFAAAAWSLGIAHPPGHPLAALWGRLFALLPLGGIGFRVALSQAGAGALAVLALTLLARDVLVRLGAGTTSASLLGGAAGLGFAFSWGLAFQSVRPEVYALHAASALGAAALVVRAETGGAPRALAAAALLCGLGLGNHHLLALAGALPLVALVATRRPRPSAGTFAVVLVAGVLALGVYLYLPVRARAAPLPNWGDPETLARLFWVVSARVFQKSVHRVSSGSVPFEIVRELGPLLALCALGGLFVLVRTPATRRLGLLLAAEIGVYGLCAALVGFDEHNPDGHGYLACALAYAAAAAVAFPVALAATLRSLWPRAGAWAAAALGVLLAVSQPARGSARFSLAQAYGAETILESALAELPPRSTLDAGYFQTVFGLWYLRAIEGVRPDVALHARHFARWPGAPPPAPSWDRPRIWEYDLDDPSALAARLEPVGLLYRVGAGATPAALRAQDATWERLQAQLAAAQALEDRETRSYLVWSFFLAAHLRCAVGARAEALAAAERVRALNRGDTAELAALRQRCQPP